MTKARNSWALWVIPSLITIISLNFPAYAKYGGGTGEPNDPYLIYTAGQMNTIGTEPNDWGKHFKLMADIDLGSFTGTSYNIIGGEWDNPFAGVFDGNNKKISNFNYSSIGRHRVGIFGYIYNSNAKVKDIGLIDPVIEADGSTSVGSLVGYLRSGVIINCYAQGGSVFGYEDVGGLVGFLQNGAIIDCYAQGGSVSGNVDVGGLVGWGDFGSTITNCYATGDVSGDEDVGGLAGVNRFQTITDCYSSASVSGYIFVGGLVGDNQGGSIINCYSNAPATGSYFVGGLVGDNALGSITCCYSSASVTGIEHAGGLVGTNKLGRITDCYSSTSVTGNNSVGGLVAHNKQGRITNCYSIGQVDGLFNVGGLVGYVAGNVSDSFWDTQTSGQSTSVGGTGLTTAEMNDPNTFINANWNLIVESDSPGGIWAEPVGEGYPILWWQFPPSLPAFSDGTGEPNNPYLISTANELNSIGHNPRLMDAHFKLINNIDLAGADFFSIGTSLYPFTGIFDGNSKKISNLGGTQGLFEYVGGENAHIKDLGLINPNIGVEKGGSGVGSLVGILRNGTIINCYAQGGSVSGGVRIGGLVGDNSSAIVSCYSSTSVSGAYTIGGLVGTNITGTITNCYAKGSVSVSDMGAGGLVGMNYAGTIENCYSVGHVKGPNDVGGLIGEALEGGTVISSFWDTQTSGQISLTGGRPGTHGLPLETDQMQTANIFLIVGWDFVDEDRNGTEDIWWILEGQDYPRLWWEELSND